MRATYYCRRVLHTATNRIPEQTNVKVSLEDDFVVTAYEEGEELITLDPVLGNEMTVLVLRKVLYIPDAGMNLISCG